MNVVLKGKVDFIPQKGLPGKTITRSGTSSRQSDRNNGEAFDFLARCGLITGGYYGVRFYDADIQESGSIVSRMGVSG